MIVGNNDAAVVRVRPTAAESAGGDETEGPGNDGACSVSSREKREDGSVDETMGVLLCTGSI